jgi:hypothetical protein
VRIAHEENIENLRQFLLYGRGWPISGNNGTC